MRVGLFFGIVACAAVLAFGGCLRIAGPFKCETDADCPGGPCVENVCLNENDPGVVERVPPELGVLQAPEAGRGCVPIVFEVAHPHERPVDVDLYYRVSDEDAWRRATPAPAGAPVPDDASGPPPTGTRGLPTRETLRAHTLVWASDVDLPGHDGPVDLRLEARSGRAVAALEVDGPELRGGDTHGELRQWRIGRAGRLIPLRLGTEQRGLAVLQADGSLFVRQPGASTFEPTVSGGSWLAAAAVDLTGDGQDEVVLVEEETATLHVVSRQSNGVLEIRGVEPPIFLDDPPDWMTAHVAAGDVLGEGARYAFVVLDRHGGVTHLTAFSGTGFETLELHARVVLDVPTPALVRLADLTGDGRLEVVVAAMGRVQVLGARFDGAEIVLETLATYLAQNLGVALELEAGDDGYFAVVDMDLGMNGLNILQLLPGAASLTRWFVPVRGEYRHVTPPRREGGRLVFHAFDGNDVVRVVLDGDAVETEMVVAAGDDVHDLVEASLDVGGPPGLAVARTVAGTPEVAFAPELPPARCMPGLSAPGGVVIEAAPSVVAVMPLDDDGYPDLLLGFETDFDGSGTYVQRMSGTGSPARFSSEWGPQVADPLDGGFTADLIGDGLPDLVFWNEAQGAGLLSGRGLQGDHEAPCSGFGVCWFDLHARAIRVLDVDGNGRMDLLVLRAEEAVIDWFVHDTETPGIVTGVGRFAEGEGTAREIVDFDAFHLDTEDGRLLGLVVLRPEAESLVELWLATEPGSTELDRIGEYFVHGEPVSIRAGARGDRVWWTTRTAADGWRVQRMRATRAPSGRVDVDEIAFDVRPDWTLAATAYASLETTGPPHDVWLWDSPQGAWLEVSDADGSDASTPWRHPLGGSARHLSVGDVSGDGRDEILVVTGPADGTPDAPVVLTIADAKLAEAARLHTNPFVSGRMVDLGDAGPALVFARSEGAGETQIAVQPLVDVRRLLYAPGPTMNRQGRLVDVVEADLDGDRRPDLAFLLAEPLRLERAYRAAGTAVGFDRHQTIPLAGLPEPWSLAAGMTARWGPAVVVGSGEGSLAVVADRGEGTEVTFDSEAEQQVRDVVLGRLVSDGRVDLVVGGADGASVLVPDDGTTPFVRVGEHIIRPEAQTVRIADVDGDGWPDLVAHGAEGTTVAFRSPESALGQGHAFGAQSSRPVMPGAGETLMEVTDLFGIGRDVVLVLSAGAGVVEVLHRPPGSGALERWGTHAVPRGASGLQVLDLDRDGRIDLVVQYPESGRIHAFWGR